MIIRTMQFIYVRLFWNSQSWDNRYGLLDLKQSINQIKLIISGIEQALGALHTPRHVKHGDNP